MTPLVQTDVGLHQESNPDWMVCETGVRWTTAAYRFAPQMTMSQTTPDRDTPSVIRVTIDQCRSSVDPILQRETPCVLIWAIDPPEMLTVLDLVISTARRWPCSWRRCVIPMVASDRLSRSGRLALAEAGIGVFLRHPEELPKYGRMIQAHFASFACGLK